MTNLSWENQWSQRKQPVTRREIEQVRKELKIGSHYRYAFNPNLSNYGADKVHDAVVVAKYPNFFLVQYQRECLTATASIPYSDLIVARRKQAYQKSQQAC